MVDGSPVIPGAVRFADTVGRIGHVAVNLPATIRAVVPSSVGGVAAV